MAGAIVAAVVEFLKIIGLVLQEIFIAKRKERIAEEEYLRQVDAKLAKIREIAADIMRRSRKESADAREREDQRERDRRREDG